MKVYVIMKGEYSDIHVVGVALDEEKAKKIAEAMSDNGGSGYGDAWVDEYDTEEFATMRIKYIVDYYESGRWEATVDDWGGYKEYTESSVVTHRENKYIVFAESQEQAIKIAQDMRAQELAKESGIC